MAADSTSDASLPCPIKNKRDLPCCLCKRYLDAIPWLSARYYGLLENCHHPFCLFCIRRFNSSRVINSVTDRFQNPAWPNVLCPVCGKQSSCIVASRNLPTNPERKYLKFQAFRECMMHMPCPFQREGFQTCFCIDQNHKYIYTTYMEKNIFLDSPDYINEYQETTMSKYNTKCINTKLKQSIELKQLSCSS